MAPLSRTARFIAPSIALDSQGQGTFVFPANQYPHGPLNLRIHAKDNAKGQDICQLQLYNQGGVKWNEGILKTDPPAAACGGWRLASCNSKSAFPRGQEMVYPAMN